MLPDTGRMILVINYFAIIGLSILIEYLRSKKGKKAVDKKILYIIMLICLEWGVISTVVLALVAYQNY